MTEAGGFFSVESRDYVREVEIDLPCKPYKPQGEISSSCSAVATLCGVSGRTPTTKHWHDITLPYTGGLIGEAETKGVSR
jgi:hypothetical protein